MDRKGIARTVAAADPVEKPFEVDLDREGEVPIFKDCKAVDSDSILDEAARVTSHDRNKSYGHPSKNVNNTAELWNANLARCFEGQSESKLTGRHVAMMMVLVKVSRDANTSKRDNLVDIAGWARVAEMLEEI